MSLGGLGCDEDLRVRNRSLSTFVGERRDFEVFSDPLQEPGRSVLYLLKLLRAPAREELLTRYRADTGARPRGSGLA